MGFAYIYVWFVGVEATAVEESGRQRSEDDVSCPPNVGTPTHILFLGDGGKGLDHMTSPDCH